MVWPRESVFPAILYVPCADRVGFFESPVLPSSCPPDGPKALPYASVMKLFWSLFSSDQGLCLLFVRHPTLQQGKGDVPSYICADDNILPNCSYLTIAPNIFSYGYIWLLDSFVSI